MTHETSNINRKLTSIERVLVSNELLPLYGEWAHCWRRRLVGGRGRNTYSPTRSI